MSTSGAGKRSVRSFVRRTGRITPAQERALAELWPEYGVDYSPCLLNLDEVFGRSAERVVEIGFGDGEALVKDAASHPEWDFLGMEVHEPGIGRCLIAAREAGIENLRVISHDAVEVLQQQIPDESLVRINLWFPDPWPKKRHHKRRLVQPAFLDLAARKLESNGSLNIATDWENYAEHIDAVIAASSAFSLAERRVHEDLSSSTDRPATKFERRGLRLGHSIFDWQLRKT